MQNPDIIHVGVLFRRISCHGLTSLCGSNLAVFHSFRGGLLAKRSVCAQTTAQNRQRADIKLPAIKPVASACYTPQHGAKLVLQRPDNAVADRFRVLVGQRTVRGLIRQGIRHALLPAPIFASR